MPHFLFSSFVIAYLLSVLCDEGGIGAGMTVGVAVVATAGCSCRGFVIRPVTDGPEKAHGLPTAGRHKTGAVAFLPLLH